MDDVVLVDGRERSGGWEGADRLYEGIGAEDGR